MRTKIYAATVALLVLWLALPGVTSARETPPGNPPSVECDGSDWYKIENGDPVTIERSAEIISGWLISPTGVFDFSAEGGWTVFHVVVKGGQDSTVHEPGTPPIQLSDNWSHVTICAQEASPSTTTTTAATTTTETPLPTATTVPNGSSTTTETPGSTTSTSTTFPPSTTTSSTSTSTSTIVTSTVTSSTTSSSTTVVSISSTATSSSTTEPTATTSSSAPSTTLATTTDGPLGIAVAIRCGSVEPIETIWSGTYTVGSTDEHAVSILVEIPPGTPAGSLEINELPIRGLHADWPAAIALPDGPIRAVVVVDGEIHAETTEDCSPELPNTGDPLVDLAVGGALLTTLGAAFLLGSRRSARARR